jgi:hypothetical protein
VSARYELYGGAYRGGKVTETRRVLMEGLAASGHVHYLNREGAWCVTSSRIGPLWELLPRPPANTTGSTS